ncbi:uncharacterized protein LOC122261530 [Penaeus japonicus]|uniref:uncharacterized protein LOC122261530 n=1 Tax=Penaeus japonicus TaxID=27405 RepID=UPI001C7171AB|nr:uncharacterized protein LOC122261530 [Penaeus japonicus]
MRVWSFLCFFLTVTSSTANNIALFWNLYDAVISGGRILHDVADGVGAVSKAIRAIDSFLDSTAQAQVSEALAKGEAEENADQKEAPADPPAAAVEPPAAAEPAATAEDVPAPSFNGCGALGFHIKDESLPVARLTECCGVHDACYSASCKANKRECDGKLRSCLFSVCDDRSLERGQQKACRGAAKLLFSGTMALSFQQYNNAQQKLACKKQQKGSRRR